jgi:hypothetical protein
MFVVDAKTPSLPMLVNRALFFVRPYSCRCTGTSNAYAILAKREKKMEVTDNCSKSEIYILPMNTLPGGQGRTVS